MILENKDCLEFLSELDTESVDLVLTDPPYFIGFDGGKGWDSAWDTEKDYLDWCMEWSEECARVLKPNGCMYVWGTTKTDTFLRYKLDVLNSLEDMVYQSWIIWSYDWGGRTKKNFARKHEDLLMYSKGKEFMFNRDDVRIPYIMKKSVRKGVDLNPLGKIPTDVWPKNNHTTSKEYAGWHPTQKPIELLERIIKAHTNPGDVVLDIFNGSGSTTIACANTDREFLGCELDKEYFEKSLKRIEDLVGVKKFTSNKLIDILEKNA